jgi:heme O synthase-like polyprenyltransferase
VPEKFSISFIFLFDYAAATGEIELQPFILFLIIFLWTPHFLRRNVRYARMAIVQKRRGSGLRS